MVKISNKIDNIGLFQEKSKQGCLGYTFLNASHPPPPLSPLEF